MRWTCSACGEEHDELPFDWRWAQPFYWDGPRGPLDRLTDDLCVWTDDDGRECYFIRGLVELPVIGAEQTFNYGVWSSLSRESFGRVLELWDEPARAEEPAYFGWLSNEIDDFEGSLNLPLDVVTRDVELRPTFVLHEGDHPLVRAQREGVPWDFVVDVAVRHLHAS
jgi:hypothetical protein